MPGGKKFNQMGNRVTRFGSDELMKNLSTGGEEAQSRFQLINDLFHIMIFVFFARTVFT